MTKCAAFILILLLNGGWSVALQSDETAENDFNSSSGCIAWKDLISKSMMEISISYLADNPRNDEKPIDPKTVTPFTPRGLFKTYYGEGASASEFKSAILDITYASYLGRIKKVNDRIQLRKSLYSLAKAGSSEMSRKTMGILLGSVIGDYGGGNKTCDKDLCLPFPLIEDAKKAIAVEFARLRNEVGESRYGSFLEIGLGSTLAFVIDDTGSMAGEINAAKKRVNIIINHVQDTLDRPQDFVLVPFNDPSIGPLTVTKDAQVFKDALAKLHAHGGGDQEEKCLGGIQLAIEASRPGSTLYVITDADAKDYKLQDSIVAEAKRKNIVVVFMLTNDLGYCRRNKGGSRYRTCFDLYQHIANETGGTVLVVKKDTIFKATKIVQTGIKQGLVLIKKQKLTGENDFVPFPVDGSISEVVVEAQGRCGNMAVLDIHGNLTSLSIIGNLYSATIAARNKPGRWKLMKSNGGYDCSVKISAKSTLGFILTVLSKPPNESEYAYRMLKGNPSPSDALGFVIDPYGRDVTGDGVITTRFITERGNKVMGDVKGDMFVQTKGALGNVDPFYISVEGRDSKGFKFARLMSRQITPSHVTVTCDFSDVVFRPGVSTTINVTVRNNGPNDTFVFGVSDTKRFASLRRRSSFIGENETHRFSIKVTPSPSSRDGVVSPVTVTARGKLPFSFQYDVCTAVVGQKKRPRVDVLSIKGVINSRFAETVVTSVVTNNADIGREAEFAMMLPIDAFIINMTMQLENETVVGKIEEKQKAKKVYDKAKKRGKAAGHVAARESSTRVFKTSLFVEPRKNVTFQLTYQQLLRRVRGSYKYQLSISPEQPIKKLQVNVYIVEEEPLSFVKVAPFKTEQVNNHDTEMPEGTTITNSRHGKSSHVRYSPSLNQQTQHSPFGLSGTFQVEYDVKRQNVYGDVTLNDGYFAHFFAPPSLPAMPKIVVYVIDTSGSMYGHKMAQVKEALSAALQRLNRNDYFNVILFNNDATPWVRYVMSPATTLSVKDAIESLAVARPVGGTNILAAFQASFDLLEPFLPDLPKVNTTEERTTLLPVIDDQRPTPISEHYMRVRRMAAKTQADVENYAKMIVFLTDGSATIGETDAKKIVKQVGAMNGGRVQINTVGFGSLAEMKMLRQLAGNNNGVSRRVFEELDAASQLEDFFDDVTNPLMTDVSINYPLNRVDDVTKNTFSVFTVGSELVLAGKIQNEPDLLDESDLAQNQPIHSQVRGKTFENTLELDFDIDPNRPSTNIMTSQHQIKNFTERLWAFLRVKDLLQEAVLSNNESVTSQLNEEVLNMSLKYNFVTPLTSFTVIRSAERELIEKELKQEEKERIREEEERRKREEEERKKLEEEPSVPTYETGGLAYVDDDYADVDYSYSGSVGRSRPLARVLSGPPGRVRDDFSPAGGFYGDPHFIIPLKSEINLCFNWDGKDREIYNLLHDDVTGMTVNGRLVTAPSKVNKHPQTYIATLAILLPHWHFKILISPDVITMLPRGGKSFSLRVTSSMTFTREGIEIRAYEVTKRTARIEIRSGGLIFYVFQRKSRNNHLDFSVSTGSKHLMAQVDGVIGQFLNADVKLREDKQADQKFIEINDRSGRVVQFTRVHPGSRDKVTCWNSPNNARDIIKGTHDRYLVDEMMASPNYSLL